MEDPDEFKQQIFKAVEAGQRNAKAMELIEKWCFHGEVDRMGGRGLVEEETGLPIGHMTMSCKYAKRDAHYCYFLEDAIYEFYLQNCKTCSERVPVGIPNITEIIEPREKADAERKETFEQENTRKNAERTQRAEERARLRPDLTLNESFVIDLIDELDADDIAADDPRLEQLANLAPETFTKKIIQYLLPEIRGDKLPYTTHAAKALLRVQLEPAELLSIALLLIEDSEIPPLAIRTIIKHAPLISGADLKRVLDSFTLLALGPSETPILGHPEELILDPEPIRSLYEMRRKDIIEEIESQIDEPDPESVETAIRLILAIDNGPLYEKNTRPIIAKLMRRRILFPNIDSKSSLVGHLRDASVRALILFPHEADKIIQLFWEDRNTTGWKEAERVYASTMSYKYQEPVAIEDVHRIAFKRLLWAAVERPEDMGDEAVSFWKYAIKEFAEVASENFNDLVGAAATLTEKYEQIDREPIIELQNDFFDDRDKDIQRTAVLQLQASLLEWAAIGAQYKGIEGIGEFLKLYRELPEHQIVMRASMITHASKLLIDVESLSLILPDWYKALMDTDIYIRRKAANAWENVPFKLVQNFPDLFFEAFAIMLTDSYLVVHQAALRSIRRRAFPEDKRNLINIPVQNLIVYYAKMDPGNDFVVDCIDVFTSICISPEERKGKVDATLIELMQNLVGNALSRLMEFLPFRFRSTPGFTQIILKALADSNTHRRAFNNCLLALLAVPKTELQSYKTEILTAFDELAPFPPEEFKKALLYVVALTRAENFAEANVCLDKLHDSIPNDNRSELWKIKTAMITIASKIEDSIYRHQPVDDLHREWIALQAELEKNG